MTVDPSGHDGEISQIVVRARKVAIAQLANRDNSVAANFNANFVQDSTAAVECVICVDSDEALLSESRKRRQQKKAENLQSRVS
jgi:hypothetical protein